MTQLENKVASLQQDLSANQYELEKVKVNLEVKDKELQLKKEQISELHNKVQ